MATVCGHLTITPTCGFSPNYGMSESRTTTFLTSVHSKYTVEREGHGDMEQKQKGRGEKMDASVLAFTQLYLNND